MISGGIYLEYAQLQKETKKKRKKSRHVKLLEGGLVVYGVVICESFFWMGEARKPGISLEDISNAGVETAYAIFLKT